MPGGCGTNGNGAVKTRLRLFRRTHFGMADGGGRSVGGVFGLGGGRVFVLLRESEFAGRSLGCLTAFFSLILGLVVGISL